MTFTHSTLTLIALLSVLSNGCAHPVSPDCAPASTSYVPVGTNYPDIAKDESQYYWVKRGDTLYAISRFFDLNYRQVAQWNRIAPPYMIVVGQKIRLSELNPGNKLMHDDRGAGAVAGDTRDGGGRATHGAVAGTKQKAVAAITTNKTSSQKKAAMPLNNKLNLPGKTSSKTHALKNTQIVRK